MPVIRNLGRAASQLLQSSGCGCGVSLVPVRAIGVSPRQVASDASFHSVTFSESDHPRVLITGQHSWHSWIPASQLSFPLLSSLPKLHSSGSKNTPNILELGWSFPLGSKIRVPCELSYFNSRTLLRPVSWEKNVEASWLAEKIMLILDVIQIIMEFCIVTPPFPLIFVS